MNSKTVNIILDDSKQMLVYHHSGKDKGLIKKFNMPQTVDHAFYMEKLGIMVSLYMNKINLIKGASVIKAFDEAFYNKYPQTIRVRDKSLCYKQTKDSLVYFQELKFMKKFQQEHHTINIGVKGAINDHQIMKEGLVAVIGQEGFVGLFNAFENRLVCELDWISPGSLSNLAVKPDDTMMVVAGRSLSDCKNWLGLIQITLPKDVKGKKRPQNPQLKLLDVYEASNIKSPFRGLNFEFKVNKSVLLMTSTERAPHQLLLFGVFGSKLYLVKKVKANFNYSYQLISNSENSKVITGSYSNILSIFSISI